MKKVTKKAPAATQKSLFTKGDKQFAMMAGSLVATSFVLVMLSLYGDAHLWILFLALAVCAWFMLKPLATAFKASKWTKPVSIGFALICAACTLISFPRQFFPETHAASNLAAASPTSQPAQQRVSTNYCVKPNTIHHVGRDLITINSQHCIVHWAVQKGRVELLDDDNNLVGTVGPEGGRTGWFTKIRSATKAPASFYYWSVPGV